MKTMYISPITYKVKFEGCSIICYSPIQGSPTSPSDPTEQGETGAPGRMLYV